LVPISKANETQAKKVNSICQNFLAWTVVVSRIFSFRFYYYYFSHLGRICRTRILLQQDLHTQQCQLSTDIDGESICWLMHVSKRERESQSRELGIFHLVPQFCEECSLGVFVGLCVKGETIGPCSFHLVPYFEDMFIFASLLLVRERIWYIVFHLVPHFEGCSVDVCYLSLSLSACKEKLWNDFSFGPTFWGMFTGCLLSLSLCL